MKSKPLTIFFRSFRRLFFCLTLTAVLFLLVACGLFSSRDSNQEAPVTLTPTTEAITPVPILTAETSLPISNTTSELAVTVWLPPDIANRTEEGAAVLANQWLAFQLSRPDVTLTVEQKNVLGQGGMLNYLLTGGDVAPAVLPDLIALPTNQLVTAANEGLVSPIEEWLEPEVVEALYPVARRLGRSDEQLIGYPFALTNLSHIAYHAELITDTLPLTWTELVTDVEGQFVFPAAGPTGATLALQFYFANGGTLVNDAGQLALQAEPLTAALSQFTMAQNNNFLAAADTSLSTVVETWQLFQGNSSALVLTTADQYLALRSTEFAPLFIPVPGPQEPLTPLVDGWAWAITTTDPTRRTLALELLAILTTDNNLGEWSFASRVLPAQEGAFAAWPDDDEYVAFVKMELEAADAFPLNASGDVLTIFQNALLNVTALGVPPSAAAEQAVQTLQP